MRRAIDALYNDLDWETQDGRVVAFNEMEHSHAVNLKRWMERGASRLQDVVLWSFLSLPEPTADGAWNAWALQLAEIESLDPLVFVRNTPAYKAVVLRLDELSSKCKDPKSTRHPIGE